MKTIYELQQEAIRLRQVKEVDSISPEETFGLHADTLAYLADMEQNAEGLGIHKVYKSFAAMNADSSAPVGTNGKPLRFGQLVAVYDKDNQSQAENGNIYAFQKGAETGWLLMGNLNSIGEATAKIAAIKSDIAGLTITNDEGEAIPTPFHVTSDVDFAWVLVDKANKPLFGLKRNGRFWSSDTKIIENKVAELSVKNSEIEETLRKVQYEVSIPSYYSEYLASKIDNINNINFKNGINSDNFIFVTDTHCYSEEEKSHILIPYIMRKTICNKCFYGGDVVGNWGGKDVVDKSIKLQMRLHEGISPYGILFNVRGNHDLFSRSLSDSVKFGYSQEQVANIMTSRMDQNKYVTNENDKGACYYYVDNTYKNIRYIVIDTTDSVNSDNGNETIFNVHKTQIIWIIKEAIMKIPSNYDIVILLHVPVVRNSSSDGSWQSYENVRTLCSALGLKKSNVTIEGETFDFSHIGGKLLMVLGGHTHGDLETYIDNVLHVSTACDRLYTGDTMYYSAWGGADVYPVRKFGTIYEQLFDYVNIDLSANIIHFIRIGAGFDRHFHITPIEVEMGKSKQIDSSLLDIITWDCVDTDGMEYGDISKPKNPVFQRETASIDSGLIVGKKQGECMVAGFDKDNNREFWYIKIK